MLRPLFLACIGLSMASDLPARLRDSRLCEPINGSDSYPWGDQASITVFLETKSKSTSVTITVYEYAQEHLLGLPAEKSPSDRYYVCDDRAIGEKVCEEKDRGQFLSSIDTTDAEDKFRSRHVDFSKLDDPEEEGKLREWNEQFDIDHSGFYCVIAQHIGGESITAPPRVQVTNAHGHIRASEFPKIWFYGATSLLYLSMGIFWAWRTLRYWREILPIQNYLAGVIALLTVEMAINYWFYSYKNSEGEVSKPLLVLSVLLNSARNSVSFFIMLIVSMGYGVVKPSLGGTIKKCVALGVIHFIFGSAFNTLNLTHNAPPGFFILVIVFCLALTMTIFYIWILTSLTSTIQYLYQRKQNFKLQMYQRVWRLLVFSATVLTIFFVVNMIYFSHGNSQDWAYKTWNWRWFVTDGWFHLLYGTCLSVIAWLWRPTQDNRRYGLEELAADEADAFDMDFSEGIAVTEGGTTERRSNAVEIFALEDEDDDTTKAPQNAASSSSSTTKLPADPAEKV